LIVRLAGVIFDNPGTVIVDELDGSTLIDQSLAGPILGDVRVPRSVLENFLPSK